MATDNSDRPDPKQAPLPESLKSQLTLFRGQLWKVKVAEALLAGVFGLLFSYLLVFGLDRIWDTPPLVRLGILVGGTSLFILFAPYWIHRWVFGHRREDQLARLIARKFPRLGDRLLGVVELQDQMDELEAHLDVKELRDRLDGLTRAGPELESSPKKAKEPTLEDLKRLNASLDRALSGPDRGNESKTELGKKFERLEKEVGQTGADLLDSADDPVLQEIEALR